MRFNHLGAKSLLMILLIHLQSPSIALAQYYGSAPAYQQQQQYRNPSYGASYPAYQTYQPGYAPQYQYGYPNQQSYYGRAPSAANFNGGFSSLNSQTPPPRRPPTRPPGNSMASLQKELNSVESTANWSQVPVGPKQTIPQSAYMPRSQAPGRMATGIQGMFPGLTRQEMMRCFFEGGSPSMGFGGGGGGAAAPPTSNSAAVSTAYNNYQQAMNEETKARNDDERARNDPNQWNRKDDASRAEYAANNANYAAERAESAAYSGGPEAQRYANLARACANRARENANRARYNADTSR